VGVLDDGTANRAGLHPIRAGGAGIEHAVGDMVESQSQPGRGGVRAWDDEESILIELLVGNGDERVVTAAVMPAQHGCGSPRAQQSPRMLSISLASATPEADSSSSESRLSVVMRAKETGGRQLPTVSDHHDLPATRNGAQGVHGLHLTGLVDHQQIELDGTRL